METNGKKNCWEFMGCGMEQTLECPAYPTGGRICYMLAGTVCNGEPHGDYKQKSRECMSCDFYREEILKSLPPKSPQPSSGTA
jgi:hypothetical protein